ncbi:MAG: hypothetical protein E6I75_02955 [Chloroflexi bacterium]|nr:MAG: hypothetical protein E6I75_02955 [Chloroflexota bacterium]
MAVRPWRGRAARLAAGGPLGQQAVGGHANIQRVPARAVHVGFVRAADCAQDAEVERGIAGLQRVKSPHDRFQAHFAGAPTLLKLEYAADAGALVRGVYARQLRVQDQSIVQPAQKGEREADEGVGVGIEGAQDEPADPLRARHCGHRQDVAVLGDAPRAALKLLARAQLICAAHVANGDRRRRRRRDSLGHDGEDNGYKPFARSLRSRVRAFARSWRLHIGVSRSLLLREESCQCGRL